MGGLIQFAAMTAAVRNASNAEHLFEIAEILAAGLMRLQARKSSQILPHIGESSLDISPAESGHQIRADRRNSDD